MRKNTLHILFASIAALLMCACGAKKEEAYQGNMKFRTLGSTGIQVAEIGIGCGVFEYLDSADSRKYMDIAMDSAINYIDIYDANPKVRSNIGYALQGRRDKMVIQGHIGSYWNTELNQYERTRDVVKAKAGFEDLLQRLGTDYIEVGMMHIFDDMADWDTIANSAYFAYIKQLKEEGKIKHIGMSSHNSAVALAAAKSGLVEVIMFSLNPAFDRVVSGSNPWDSKTYENLLAGIDPVRTELYNYCTQHQIAITVMKTFGGGGRLLDGEKSPLGFALTTDQCIAYALANPSVAVALVGSREIQHLIDDLHYLVATEEEKDYSSALNKGGQVAEAECTYCGHCTPCPAGIDIAKVNELLDIAKNGKATDKTRAEYEALEHHASECTACGACESRCPFGVPVREKMKEAVKTFGK
ncbi:MAG: aldo/keto reductase [Bacteroidales bacterium]|nr:aldo/keto reductase [Bacteroidales bacterium]